MSQDRAEARIRELADAGELRGLPGEGRPFLCHDLEGDDATWAAFRLMRNNGMIPVWSQERIDIDAEVERLRSRCRVHGDWLAARSRDLLTLAADRLDAARVTSRQDERFRAELEARVRELDLRIDRYNAIVPVPSLALVKVSAAALLASGS